MVYKLLGEIIAEARKGEESRAKIIHLNKIFSEAFFVGEEGRKLPEDVQMKYNSCLNAALASLNEPHRRKELLTLAQKLYQKLPTS